MLRTIHRRFLLHDIRQQPAVTGALLLVITLSGLLMTSGAVVIEKLHHAVDTLFETAKPPHFVQMHQGDYNPAALETFASQYHNNIDAWQIQELWAVPGSNITVTPTNNDDGRGITDFSDSLIDNLFVTQNRHFDFLVDQHGTPVDPAPGQVYVPIAYATQYDLQPGAQLNIETATGVQYFTVAGTVRDAQMGSAMASATRFVVAAQDHHRLTTAGGGTPEIMVQYRLTQGMDPAEFQRHYQAATNLPHNGQAVTAVMIRLVTVFSDGLVAVGLIFGSLVLAALGLLNISFVIRNTVEEQLPQIGTMRAIGIPTRTITGLYLLRYGALAVVGTLMGEGLAVSFAPQFTVGIHQHLMVTPTTATTVLAPAGAVVVMFGLITGVCWVTLHRATKIQVLDALVQGRTTTRKQRFTPTPRQQTSSKTGSQLGTATGQALNRRLAWIQLRTQARQWLVIPAIFLGATILVTLPINLLTTFQHPSFMTYLGAPQSDLRADTTDPAVLQEMQHDPRITAVQAYAQHEVEVQHAGGMETVTVQTGDYTDVDLQYIAGGTPAPGQIAVSTLNAQQLNVQPGDTLLLQNNPAGTTVTVSGIYQDVTAGGYTAKLHQPHNAQAKNWTLYAHLADGQDPKNVAKDYNKNFPTTTVLPMQEYVAQTLSHLTGTFQQLTVVLTMTGLGAVGLITTVFLRLKLTQDRTNTALLAVLGFSAKEIAGQTIFKVSLAVATGIITGVLATATLGEWFVSQLLTATNTGIVHLTFFTHPALTFLAIPAALFLTGLTSTLILKTPRKATP